MNWIMQIRFNVSYEKKGNDILRNLEICISVVASIVDFKIHVGCRQSLNNSVHLIRWCWQTTVYFNSRGSSLSWKSSLRDYDAFLLLWLVRLLRPIALGPTYPIRPVLFYVCLMSHQLRLVYIYPVFKFLHFIVQNVTMAKSLVQGRVIIHWVGKLTNKKPARL